MDSNDINNLEKQIEESVVDCYCNFSNLSPVITGTIVIGTALTTATIISPKVRKLTIPLTKFALKQQVRLLAGLGVLSIAHIIANSQADAINDFK